MRGLLLLIVTGLISLVHAQNDFEYWNTLSMEKEIAEDVFIDVRQGIRLDNHWSRFKMLFFQTSAKKKINKQFNFVLGYRFRTKVNETTQRVYTDANFIKKLDKFQFQLRNRIQYDVNNEGETVLKWRDRALLSYSINKGKLKPYIASEIFMDVDGSYPGFSQVRFSSGVDIKFSKRTVWELFVGQQDEYFPDTERSIMIGNSISINLK